jgi:hypothetical protein
MAEADAAAEADGTLLALGGAAQAASATVSTRIAGCAARERLDMATLYK